MAAASNISRQQSSNSTRITTTAAASKRTQSQSQINKTQPVSSKSPRSPTASPLSASSTGGPVASLNNYRQHPHLSSSSTTSLTGSQKSGSLFALAAAALDKTFSGISEPRIRPRQSLSRLSIGPESALSSPLPSPEKSSSRHRTSSSNFSSSSTLLGEGKYSGTAALLKEPASRPYSEADPNQPAPILIPRVDNKMHQTSSRLLRMTDDDRPFTKVGT